MGESNVPPVVYILKLCSFQKLLAMVYGN